MGEEITASLTTEELYYMSAHFLLLWRSWCRYRMTWSMVHEGREVSSRTDYILGMDCCLFWYVSVWDPRHKSYHYLVSGCLRSAPLREHFEYLMRRKQLLL